MTTQTPVSTIQLDKMTRAQFDALTTKDQTHLYVLTDESSDGLPDQTGHSGQFLTTNGTSASWTTISTAPETDNNTISINSQNKLQTIGVIDKKTSSANYDWTGTLAEYNALSEHNPNWFYYITDDTVTPSGGSIDWGSAYQGDLVCNETYVCVPYRFTTNDKITSFSAPNLTSCSFYYAFMRCFNLRSVNLPALTAVNCDYSCAYAFTSCTGLTSVDLSSLTTISGYFGCNNMFKDCYSLTSVDLSALTTISGTSSCYYVFNNCTSLASINLSSLTTISGSECCYGMFFSCSSLTSLSFPSLTTSSFGSYTNQFNNMFNANTASVSGTCTVHFPSNLQSTIAGLTGYPLFGGASGKIVLAFDLPATS